MEYKYYEKYINKKTRQRYDITPIFQDAEAFCNLVSDLIKPFENQKIDKIAGLDALGFVIGGAVANQMKLGFVPVRKGGKLPSLDGVIRTSFVDYTKEEKSFEINKDSIKPGDRVLMVDDWVETGSQVNAAIKLIEKVGGNVIGISCLNADKTEGTKLLFEKYNLHSIRDDEH